MNQKRWLILSLVGALCGPAFGGVFHLADNADFDPFIVVHPAGYDGVTGGLLEVKICLADDSALALPAVREAVALWNALTPTTGNCPGCEGSRQGAGVTGEPLSMTSVMLHELGHCALGLGHINWIDRTGPDPVETNFTNTKDATAITAGADGVAGSSDDIVTPLPGSRLLHWYRVVDNDPFVIDGTPIDISTYSRRILDLPGDDNWPANGNLGVGALLTYPDTQGVMYTSIGGGERYVGLTADEINTVRFGMSGMDEIAGTSDDYTVSLSITDCASANVEVKLVDFGPDPAVLGSCLSDLDPLPTGGTMVHHALIPFSGFARAEIEVSRSELWDVIFANGFESGDLAGWSASN